MNQNQYGDRWCPTHRRRHQVEDIDLDVLVEEGTEEEHARDFFMLGCGCTVSRRVYGGSVRPWVPFNYGGAA